jgi:hypothetical protein
LNSDEIQACLEKLGYKLSSHGNHWRTSALYRSGDNPTSLQIYKNSGIWKDFVSDTPYMPFISLVQITLKTNDPNILKEYAQNPLIHNQKFKKEKVTSEKIFEKDCLDKLLPHYSFYNKKGIPDFVLDNLYSGLATEGGMYQRYVFPIFNENSDIHGFSGRDMSGSKNRPKWKHMGKKSSWVYPFYVPCKDSNFDFLEDVRQKKSIFLIESIGDLINMHSNGILNAGVLFGLNIGSKFLSFLMSLDLNNIYISLNNDCESEVNRGQIASVSLFLKLLKFFNKSKLCIVPPNKNDFGDMNEKDFSLWKRNINSMSSAESIELVKNTTKNKYYSKFFSNNILSNLKYL